MAAGFNTAANITAYVQTIFEDAMLVARENTLATNLVTVYADRSGTAVRSNSQYGTATINQIGELDDLVSQAITPSVLQSLTPYEFGAQFVITDLAQETDPFPIMADASQELGIALADKVDRDIFGNFSSLTGGTIGTSGTTLAWGHFMAMHAILKNQKAPGPYVFVCHPYQWHNLAKAASVASTARTNAPEYLMEAVARQYWVANYNGVDIYVSSNVPVSGTDAYAAMFARPALAYDVRRAARVERERDASRRGWELNLSTVYAHGVWRPTYGVQFIGSVAAPTE